MAAKKLPAEAYEFYMFHPVEFIEHMVLCLEPADVIANKVGKRMEPQSKEILRAVAAHDYVSVFSGRGCCKTTSLAFLMIWWVWTRNESRVILCPLTSLSGSQPLLWYVWVRTLRM